LEASLLIESLKLKPLQHLLHATNLEATLLIEPLGGDVIDHFAG